MRIVEACPCGSMCVAWSLRADIMFLALEELILYHGKQRYVQKIKHGQYYWRCISRCSRLSKNKALNGLRNWEDSCGLRLFRTCS